MENKLNNSKAPLCQKQGSTSSPLKIGKKIVFSALGVTLFYYYIKSIIDFRAEAHARGIEVHRSSDLIWMLIATLGEHIFITMIKRYLRGPVERTIRKNCARNDIPLPNIDKTMRQITECLIYTIIVIVGVIGAQGDPRLPP